MKGLFNFNLPFYVYDKNGNFQTEVKEKGIYFINGTTNVQGVKVEKKLYSVRPLFVSEKKDFDLSFNETLKFDNRPEHKASTLYKEHTIFFNQNFLKKLNKYEKFFVTMHEIGHRFYFNENACDLFAIHNCLNNFIDLRFIDFDKILNSKERKDFIKNSYKILK